MNALNEPDEVLEPGEEYDLGGESDVGETSGVVNVDEQASDIDPADDGVYQATEFLEEKFQVETVDDGAGTTSASLVLVNDDEQASLLVSDTVPADEGDREVTEYLDQKIQFEYVDDGATTSAAAAQRFEMENVRESLDDSDCIVTAEYYVDEQFEE